MYNFLVQYHICNCIGEYSQVKSNGLSGFCDQWNRSSNFFSSHFLRVIVQQTSFLWFCTLFCTDVWTNCLNFKNPSVWHTCQIQHWQCQRYGFHELQNLNQNKIWGSLSQECDLLELSGPDIEDTTILQSISNSSPVDTV